MKTFIPVIIVNGGSSRFYLEVYLEAMDQPDQTASGERYDVNEDARTQAQQTLERRIDERTKELAALNDLAVVVSRTLNLKEIMSAALSKTMELMGMELGAAYSLVVGAEGGPESIRLVASVGLTEDFSRLAGNLPLAGSMVESAAIAKQPVIVDVNRYPNQYLREVIIRQGAIVAVTVPLMVKASLLGAIFIGTRRERLIKPGELALLDKIGQQVGAAVKNARLYDQVQQTALLEERSRLARELHDSVTQSLYSINLYAEATARLLTTGDSNQAIEHLRQLRDIAQEALREMRLLVFELRPLALEKMGLADALRLRLEAVEARGGIQTELSVDGEDKLPLVIQEELYHIAQEALNNILKHANAHYVGLRLDFVGGGACLEINDDGTGFELEAAQSGGGLGLAGMVERARRIGANLDIDSTAGQGTRICVNVPASTVEYTQPG